MLDCRKSKNKNRKTKTRCRYGLTALYVFLILVFAYYAKQGVLAESTTTNSSSDTESANQEQIQDKQEQIDDLQKKAESYRQMIEMKQDKAETLENQIKLMESEISSLQSDIGTLQKDIDQTSTEIGNLSGKIEDKEKDIAQKRIVLSGLVQTYYENSQDTLTEFMLRGSTLSDFLSQTDYISQTGIKVDDVLTSFVSDKEDLEIAEKTLELKNNDQKERQGKILEKRRYLDDEQQSKEQLLNQTQGEEQKYQSLLSQVEKQKQELLGDISALSVERSSALAEVEASIQKPKSGLASTSWYFAQTDSRWGDKHIGFSNTLMKNYGCAVTAVAMVLRYHGSDIDPGTLAKQPIYYHDLIVWPGQWKGVELVSSHTHGNIDWKVIDTELKNKNPVIVFIRATNRGAGHYVVVHSKDKNGDYVVHDPYWGANIFLSSTRAYVSALYGGGTKIDQMIIYH